jgi:hypothetical protein
LNGLTNEEMARAVGATKGAIRLRLMRARHFARAYLIKHHCLSEFRQMEACGATRPDSDGRSLMSNDISYERTFGHSGTFKAVGHLAVETMNSRRRTRYRSKPLEASSKGRRKA